MRQFPIKIVADKNPPGQNPTRTKPPQTKPHQDKTSPGQTPTIYLGSYRTEPQHVSFKILVIMMLLCWGTTGSWYVSNVIFP